MRDHGFARPERDMALKAVLAVTRELAGRLVEPIGPESRFSEDLAIDSLEFVQMVQILEDELDLAVPDALVSRAETIADLVDVIALHSEPRKGVGGEVGGG